MLIVDSYLLLRRLIVQNFFSKLSYRFTEGSLQIEIGARMISGLRSYMTSPYKESAVLIAGGQVFVLPNNNCKNIVEQLNSLASQASEISIAATVQFVDFDSDDLASEVKTIINCKPQSFMVHTVQTADLIPGEVSPEDSDHRVLYAPGAEQDEVALKDVENSDIKALAQFALLKRYEGMTLVPYSYVTQEIVKNRFTATFIDTNVETNNVFGKYIAYNKANPSLKLGFYCSRLSIAAIRERQWLQIIDPLLGSTALHLDQIVFEKQE